jgi:F0F1-type ATP synthase assembly protein I
MEPSSPDPWPNRSLKDAREFRVKNWLGKFMIVGANFLAGPLVLGLAGRWLDHRTGHEYRFLIIGVILGLVWAFYEAFKIAWYISKEDRENRPDGQKK